MTEQNNPYNAPESNVIEEKPDHSAGSKKSVIRPKEVCVEWIKNAFNLFKSNAPLWIGVFMVYAAISSVGVIIPFAGALVIGFVSFILTTGLMQCAHEHKTRGQFEIGTLFSFFKASPEKKKKLLIGAAIFMGLIAVAYLPMMLGVMLSPKTGTQGVSPLFVMGCLFTFALFLPLFMAYWFAPSLLQFTDAEPVEAFKLSLFACVKNRIPMVAYFIGIIALTIVAVIPFGLGLLVVGPMSIIAMYLSYADVFSG